MLPFFSGNFSAETEKTSCLVLVLKCQLIRCCERQKPAWLIQCCANGAPQPRHAQPCDKIGCWGGQIQRNGNSNQDATQQSPERQRDSHKWRATTSLDSCYMPKHFYSTLCMSVPNTRAQLTQDAKADLRSCLHAVQTTSFTRVGSNNFLCQIGRCSTSFTGP